MLKFEYVRAGESAVAADPEFQDDANALGDPGAAFGTEPETVTTYADLPIFTTDQIARQLTHAYWGGSSHRFAVAPGGSLTVNLNGLTAEGRFLAREALATWTDASGIRFTEVSTGAQMTFDDDRSGAFASASFSGSTTTSAQVNISTQWIANYGTGLNTYSFQTYVHEIGHALGLGHGGNYNGGATYSVNAHYANDSWATTVMSYFDQSGNTYFRGLGFTKQFVLTPMFADGVAIASLYGVNTFTRTGDTTYGFNNTSGREWYNAAANPSVSYTIFDNGGTDTLDYSGFFAAQRIDLNAEAFSNVGGRVGNVVIARGAVIENAIGGSGADILVGNAVDNRFTGGGSNDRIEGGGGNDTAVYAGARAQYTLTGAGASWTITGAEGTDTLIDVERVQFSDQLLVLGTAPPPVVPPPPPPVEPPVVPPPGEVPGSTASTVTLPLNASVNSGLEVAGDHDWFRVDLVAGLAYVFETSTGTSGAAVDTTLTLRNGSGVLLTTNDDISSSSIFSRIAFTATASGTYFLDVGGFNATVGDYRLSATVADIAASTATTATLGIGTSASSAIATANDHDWFRVSLTAGQTYVFRTAAPAAGTAADTTLAVRDAAGTQLAFNDDFSGLFSQVTYTAATTGTYYVDVGAYSTLTGGYTVSAATGTPLPPPVEVPGTIASTVSLAIDSSVASQLDNASDHDFFRVQLSAGQTYVFETTEGAAGGDPDTTLSLRNSAGTQLAFNDDTLGLFSRIQFTASTSGTYFLDVAGFEGDTGTYTLRATAGALPVDIAASTATTAAIGIGASLTSALDTSGDHDWFRVDLVAGQAYTFRTGAGSSGAIDTTLALRNSTGAQVAFNDDQPTSVLAALQYTATASGTYYLDVGAYGSDTGSYSLTFVAPPPNDVLVDDAWYYARNPDVAAAGVNADVHYNTSGWREGRDPNAWFDTSEYLAANPDVRAAGINPLAHYAQSGWREGRDAGLDFDTGLYLARNSDVLAAGMNPLLHFVLHGFAEGRHAYAAVGPLNEYGFDRQYYLMSNPDVAQAGLDPWQHFLASGWREGRDPNALFDTSAYLAANRDVAAAGLNPLTHFAQSGWREGRDPGPGFDTTAYLTRNGDVRAAGIDPLQHYLNAGIAEGRGNAPAVGPVNELGFDRQFYLMSNVDVAQAGLDPFSHFMNAGWREGRDANAFFDTSEYLAANADVARAGLNPLVHYMQSGWREGRDPSADFDTGIYLRQHADVAAAGLNPLLHYLTSGLPEGRRVHDALGPVNGSGFDAQHYLMTNADVAQSGTDPYQHFLNFGWREGRDPNAIFDVSWYLEVHRDVAQAGLNPLLHYVQSGWRENRDPSEFFDTSFYLQQNADVRAAGLNPMLHYLMSGALEGRRPEAATEPAAQAELTGEMQLALIGAGGAEANPGDWLLI